ncbi:MAG: CotH kinase family protein [Flavobacteriales bacterium]|nr:CotH kinase family protein [Flavobacteriales bacterium]
MLRHTHHNPGRMRTPFTLALALAGHAALAQALPDAMYLSPDGRILYTNGQDAGGLYREDTVRAVYLNFSQPNYWALLTANYASQTPIPASMVVDGVTYDSVAVRFKGQTSYSQLPPGSQKKSFDVDMNGYIAGQDLKGYESLNFNNSFQDNSFMREVVYLHMIRRHIPAAKANYIKLYLNGQNWGLYPNVQGLDGEFLKEWYFNNNGTRWRADRPTGGMGGQWGDGTAALNYLGPDTALYQQYYTLQRTQKANPWDDLVRVCDKLNNTPLASLRDSLELYMDVDRVLWFLACEIAFSDDDSYVHKGKMDYCLYWDEVTGRMVTHEYDGNSMLSSNALTWSPFYNATNANYPLMNRLFAVPELRQRYLAHLRVLIAEQQDPTLFNQVTNGYKALIDTIVQNDPKKLMTYTQFNSGVTALQGNLSTRRNYLLGNAEVAQVGPVIGAVDHYAGGVQNAAPTASEAVTVRASVSSGTGISGVRLFWCAQLFGPFERASMFDDGAHDDGASGDGVYGATIPAQAAGTWVRYYIEAKANNAALSASYAPPGAEHDVYVYQVQLPPPPAPSVVINEVMASNAATAADDHNEYDDWIELYNPSGASVDLSGWFLTDDAFNLYKWPFPQGTVLADGDYLIVWADEDGWQGPLHANFKLSGSGEEVRLINSDSMQVDQATFGAQTTDLGYARVPNGFGPFVIQTPTFGANNNTVGVAENELALMALFPNPTTDGFTLTTGSSEPRPVEVYDAMQRLVWSGVVTTRLSVDTDGWAGGTYVVRCGPQASRLVLAR